MNTLTNPCETCATGPDNCIGHLACTKYQHYLSTKTDAAADSKELARLRQRNRHLVEEEKARQLHSQGLTDQEIADALCTSKPAVAYWRRGKGLKANSKRGVAPVIQKEEAVLENSFDPSCLERIGSVMSLSRTQDTVELRKHFAGLARSILVEALADYIIEEDKPNAEV